MKYSQAVNAMFRGHDVALRSEPGITYSFDGAEKFCIWAYHEATDDFVHIDNVDFERMMKRDWYVLPEKRQGYRQSSRQWSILNWLLHRRASMLDLILAGVATGFMLTPLWFVSLIACGLGAAISATIEKKWQTDV